MVCFIQLLKVFFPPGNRKKEVKAIHVHAWTGPEGSSRLRLIDFRTSQHPTCLEICNFQIAILNGPQWYLHWFIFLKEIGVTLLLLCRLLSIFWIFQKNHIHQCFYESCFDMDVLINVTETNSF